MLIDKFNELINTRFLHSEFLPEYKPIRERKYWPLEKMLYEKELNRYIEWHEKNGKLYADYEKDKAKLKLYNIISKCSLAVGPLFSILFFNPNYTAPRSRYVRAFSIGYFTLIFYILGNRPYRLHKTLMDYKMYDYMPHEVRLAIRTQDHRYLMNFDPSNPDHVLFDPATGKGY